MTTRVRPTIRFVDGLRTAETRREISIMRSIRNRLESDVEFRAFHEGRKVPLPRYYREIYRRRLGRYSELVREPLISPVLEPPLCAAADGRSQATLRQTGEPS
jgi:hypothetical protein